MFLYQVKQVNEGKKANQVYKVKQLVGHGQEIVRKLNLKCSGNGLKWSKIVRGGLKWSEKV